MLGWFSFTPGLRPAPSARSTARSLQMISDLEGMLVEQAEAQSSILRDLSECNKIQSNSIQTLVSCPRPPHHPLPRPPTLTKTAAPCRKRFARIWMRTTRPSTTASPLWSDSCLSCTRPPLRPPLPMSRHPSRPPLRVFERAALPPPKMLRATGSCAACRSAPAARESMMCRGDSLPPPPPSHSVRGERLPSDIPGVM